MGYSQTNLESYKIITANQNHNFYENKSQHLVFRRRLKSEKCVQL